MRELAFFNKNPCFCYSLFVFMDDKVRMLARQPPLDEMSL